jgi:hypothetical protein
VDFVVSKRSQIEELIQVTYASSKSDLEKRGNQKCCGDERTTKTQKNHTSNLGSKRRSHKRRKNWFSAAVEVVT